MKRYYLAILVTICMASASHAVNVTSLWTTAQTDDSVSVVRATSNNWNTAYSERATWSGTAVTSASAGRTALGLDTVYANSGKWDSASFVSPGDAANARATLGLSTIYNEYSSGGGMVQTGDSPSFVQVGATSVVTGTLTLTADPTADTMVGDRAYNDARYVSSATNTAHYVSLVTFTNGWSISCTTNGLEFVAP